MWRQNSVWYNKQEVSGARISYTGASPVHGEYSFLVKLDYACQRRILSLEGSDGRLARWLLQLMEFDFEASHRPGAQNQAAHAMSRLPSAFLVEGKRIEADIDDEISTYCI